jgi:hypothetical protein
MVCSRITDYGMKLKSMPSSEEDSMHLVPHNVKINVIIRRGLDALDTWHLVLFNAPGTWRLVLFNAFGTG